MKKMIFILSFFFAISIFASNTNKNPGALSLQIIQNHMLLNKNNITAAKVGETKKDRAYVEIKLTPKAAKRLRVLSSHSIGKKAEIVWNDNVISMTTIESPLGQELMLLGFTLQQAETFVDALKLERKKGV